MLPLLSASIPTTTNVRRYRTWLGIRCCQHPGTACERRTELGGPNLITWVCCTSCGRRWIEVSYG